MTSIDLISAKVGSGVVRSQVRHMAVVAAMVVGMAALGFLHLLTGTHYPLVSYDSFYFHHLARYINQGGSVPLIGYGLAYPVAYLGRLIGLQAASLVISPILGALTGLILYLGVSRLYSARVGLYTLGAFVVAQIPRFVYMSGNLDRDGLHMLIMTAGILGLALYFKTQQRIYLAAAFGALPLMWLEWGWFALVQYTPVLVGVCLLSDTPGLYRDKSTWVGLGLMAVGVAVLGRMAMRLSIFNGWNISELQPISVWTLVQYATLAVPLVFGVRAILGREGKAEDSLVMSWTAILLLMGCVASRLAEPAAIPACILAGIGLESMWKPEAVKATARWSLVFATAVGIFAGLSWTVPQNVSMDREWQDALEWVRDNTPEDATVAVWWSYGYWVEDVAQRRTVATNATDPHVDTLACLYCADNPQEAQDVMARNGWDYVMVSSREGHFMDAIRTHCIGSAPGGFYRQATSGDGLVGVYANKSVTVLGAA